MSNQKYNWDSYVGKKFGQWTVLGIDPERRKHNKIGILVRCDCGKEGVRDVERAILTPPNPMNHPKGNIQESCPSKT